MANLLKVINFIVNQNGSISKDTIKALYQEYKITFSA